MPLSDFLSINFSSSNRGQQNGFVVHAPQASVDPSSITSPNQHNQRQITVQRIGRDARPLLPCEIARYQHMFSSNQSTRSSEPTQQRRSDVPIYVPEVRDRPESARLRSLAQRIPRLNPVATATSNNNNGPAVPSGSTPDIRIIPWSERSRLQYDRSLDEDYVLRLPVLDLSRVSGSGRQSTSIAGNDTANPRPPPDNADVEYN